MSILGQIKQQMEIIGANGIHVGTVDAVLLEEEADGAPIADRNP